MSGPVCVEYVLVTPFGQRACTCVQPDEKAAAEFVAVLSKTYGCALSSVRTTREAETQKK